MSNQNSDPSFNQNLSQNPPNNQNQSYPDGIKLANLQNSQMQNLQNIYPDQNINQIPAQAPQNNLQPQNISTNLQNPILDSGSNIKPEKEPSFYEKQKSKYYNIDVKFVSQFLTFLKQFGIVALALGVVIGQTTNKLINSMVENIITPIINLLLPGNTRSFESLEFFGIKYGAFISSLIEFVLVLLIIFLVVNFVISKLLTSEEKQKLNIESKENE